MAKRTVLASWAADGHVQLLEFVELPPDEKFAVTLDLPEKRPAAVANWISRPGRAKSLGD